MRVDGFLSKARGYRWQLIFVVHRDVLFTFTDEAGTRRDNVSPLRLSNLQRFDAYGRKYHEEGNY